MADRKIKRIAIVGAGLSGATLAYQLSLYGIGEEIIVFDKRGHLAGNAHTERDPQTGVMLHKYGPHIFHTDRDDVWAFVKMFADFKPYIQRTKGLYNGNVYSLPINLHTINQFYGRNFTPEEAWHFIRNKRPVNPVSSSPRNFEEAALDAVGFGLYEAFLYGYTLKQWGRRPRELPVSVLKRLPLRFDYNDNAFFHKHQGMPTNGYTELVYNMLDLSNVATHLGFQFKPAHAASFDHVFYSGPIDEWFSYCYGRLPYRTLDFEVIRAKGDFQGCSVMNNCDHDVPWTRSTEHKHFTPWETHTDTIVYRETPRECEEHDIPYYPIRLATEQAQLRDYQELATREANVSFVGRLGTYQYLDMDATIAHAIDVAKDFRVAHKTEI